MIKFMEVPTFINSKYEQTKDEVFFEKRYLIELERVKQYINEYGDESYDLQIFDVKPLKNNFHFLVPICDSLTKLYNELCLKIRMIEESIKEGKNLIFSNYKHIKESAEHIRQLEVWFSHHSQIFFSLFMYIHREEIFENKNVISQETACNIKTMIYNDLNMYISQKRA